MNDDAPAASAPTGPSAGRLLREAREKRGMHIAALAASIKVTPKKLEALESDRIDLLPDATFARALAQTVCRALKIDSGPVMALLPPRPTTGSSRSARASTPASGIAAASRRPRARSDPVA